MPPQESPHEISWPRYWKAKGAFLNRVVGSQLEYRVEIDGLRAVAVLLVLLNHAQIPFFAGGFLGVDVFFVISGYLITTIILREMNDGSFRYLNFLERRARRILPAFFGVLIPVTVMASVWLIGNDKENFFNSLIAAVTFWPNIRFFVDLGYFDTAAIYKPLLHTWSLGVEEQFYLLFPLLLFGVARRKIAHQLTPVVLVGVTSFVIMIASSPAAAFYLLPSRMWEFLAGTAVAMLKLPERFQDAERANRRWLNNVDTVGLLAIALAATLVGKDVRWPSMVTLIPVVGTVLVLVAASPTSFAGRALSWRPLSVIGLSSYSIYLWHYPLFAFARYQLGKLEMSTTVLLMGLSLVLGWISWRIIERPFRGAERFSRRKIFAGAITGCFSFLIVGGYLAVISGSNVDSKLASVENPTAPIQLIGDSHAYHLVPGLQPRLGNNLGTAFSAGCVPLWNVDRFDFRFEKGKCAEFSNAAIESALQSKDVKLVVLASMGPVYLTGESFSGLDQDRVVDDGLVLVDSPEIVDRWKVFEIGLRNTFRILASGGKHTVFIIDIPELGIEPQRCKVDEPKSCENSWEKIDLRTKRYRSLVQEVGADFSDVTIFDPTDLFCDDKVCAGIRNGQPLYKDGDHLSDFGSEYLGNVLRPFLTNLLKSS